MKITGIDSDDFDVEAMQIDIAHKNLDADFSAEDAERYRHENIVRDSIVNGQHSQAREQCRRYGLDYAAIKFSL